MLSNENPTQASLDYQIAEARAREARARGRARALAQHMINYDRNPEPHPERNVTNPAHGVRIRKVVPILWTPVPDDVKEHNSAVSELRKP